ncbi:MAG: ATP-binding cassette domain-containing protein [Methylobacterium sp.]|nr:ATP-binding cassette domain-containing protein [Methylobacterium sp.]MCA3607547.1 ATP-binding cassette domain-containing protein [Methylobacterium sp.]MCA3609489.1 ATP-binding cassette domain-containing protein [Methylobacterium sp.]MCA3618697.1 ATP-binding cassette domain-containing protein [Methylobacterium sp.]MCA3620683.1 ATP-binding cassette domain-containing protein [Methylobacterium sp.]
MLSLTGLTYRLGNRLLLDNATAQLPMAARTGLIGRNGCGKSTLFKLILGEIALESGTIAMPRQAILSHVAQEAPGGPETLLDTVLAADTERLALLKEAETATDPSRIADIQLRLADIGAEAAPARAASILSGLGFSAGDIHRPCSEFSGGWRMRVALAAVLFREPDLLLLDEPTNYLDIEGAFWLTEHLKRYPHTLVVISHDRDFLDEVTDHTLHMDRGKLTLYRGGYSSFARQRAEKAALAEKAAEKQAAERAHLQAFIDRFKAKASKAKQAQSRVKRLEKLGPVANFAREEAAEIHLPDPEKPLQPPILSMEGASAGYGERTVLAGLTLRIAEDDRIGLLGQNGNGKSTLVKLIAGRLEAKSGEVIRARGMNIAYFAQHQLDELDSDATPALLVRRKLPQAGEAVIRSAAARLGFGAEKADTPISSLSGGEKARLLLGLAAFEGPHLLILDEPTNHLDIPMRDALVEALAGYKGAVIIVSHDRSLLDAACDRLWVVAEGRVKPFEDDLDAYAKLVLEARRDSGKRESEAARSAKEDRRASAEKRQNQKPLREKAKVLEQQVEKLAALLARADEALANPAIFRDQPAKATQLARDRASLAEKLAAAEEEWLMVMAELESIG